MDKEKSLIEIEEFQNLFELTCAFYAISYGIYLCKLICEVLKEHKETEEVKNPTKVGKK